MAHIFGSIWDRFNRNALNDLSKNVEVQGKSIQDLVAEGQLTPTQYAELITVINGRLKSGEVNKYDLGSELIAEIERVNTMRLNTADRPIDVDEMNTRTKQLFTGGAVAVVGENSVGRENVKLRAIDESRTSFLKTGKNKFNGSFISGFIADIFERVAYYGTANRFSAITPIEKGKTYTITKFDGGNRFNVLLIEDYPNHSNIPMESLESYYGNQSRDKQTYTFTNDVGANYVLIHTNSGDAYKPNVQVEEGNQSTEFEEGGLSFTEPLKELENVAYLERSNKNLFDGNYIAGITSYANGGAFNSGLENRWSAVVPIEEGLTYTVTKLRGGDRFNIDLLYEYPDIARGEILEGEKGYRGDEDGSEQTYSFTNDVGASYVIVNTNAGANDIPRIQVEIGDSFTGYEPYKYIPERYLPLELNGEKDISPDFNNYLYTFSDDLQGIYSTDNIENLSNPVNAQVSEVISLYDDLQADFPDYISPKKDLGSVDDENIYSYTFSPHTLDSNVEINIPRVILISGTHGNEKNTVYSLFNFLKKVCTEWRDDKILEFFRFNIEFIVVPIVNPIGFNNFTRNNGNNVDLNRDFPPDSTEITDNLQSETKIIMQFLSENKDAEYILDYHRMNFRDGYMSYALTNNKHLSEMANKTINTMGRKWQKDYEFFPQDENHKFGYTDSHIIGSLAKHAEFYGGKGILLEMVEKIDWKDGWSRYDDLTVLTGTELLANTLKGMIKLI